MSNLKSEIKEDFLEVDNPISGQNFVCLSFLSPENILKEKELFIFNHFLKDILSSELNDLKEMDENTLSEKYNDYRFTNESELTKQFFDKNENKTCIRGLKVRGVYDTYKEAQVRAQVLQRLDSSFNIYIGQVGHWLPWDPSPEQVQDQEYLESELNDLMKEYKKNQQQKDIFFQEQIREKKKKMEEENIKKKEEIARLEKNETLQENNIVDNIQEEDPWMKQKKEIIKEV